MTFIEGILEIPLMFYLSLVIFGVLLYIFSKTERSVPAPGPVDMETVVKREEISVKTELKGIMMTGGIIGFAFCIIFFTYGLVQDYRNSRGLFYPQSLVSDEALPSALNDLPPAK